ncbi:MAG: TRAP transporter substrate-binding protein [bacterium]|nr:TRAP transporter substrate-binding protein [bacterium]
MKKLLFTLLIVMLALCLAIPAFAAKARVLKFSSIHEPTHPSAITAEFFADRVQQLTNGEVEIQVYHSRQLGDAIQNVENVRNGSIAMTSISIANLSQVNPKMDMFSLPYIFKSGAHYWHILNNPKTMEFMSMLEPKGIKVVSWIDSGARSLFTQEPVNTPEDMKGMKIRVMASPVMISTMNALGANGVPVAWGELYNALQTGVVDGAENNPPSLISMKFYEVSKYFTIDEHMRIPDANIISAKVFSKLSESQQAAIMKAGEEATAFMRGAWAISRQQSLMQLEKLLEGIIEPDKQPFIDSVSELVKTEAARLEVEDMVNWIMEEGNNF